MTLVKSTSQVSIYENNAWALLRHVALGEERFLLASRRDFSVTCSVLIYMRRTYFAHDQSQGSEPKRGWVGNTTFYPLTPPSQKIKLIPGFLSLAFYLRVWDQPLIVRIITIDNNEKKSLRKMNESDLKSVDRNWNHISLFFEEQKTNIFTGVKIAFTNLRLAFYNFQSILRSSSFPIFCIYHTHIN